MKKWLKIGLSVLVILYIILVIGLYFFQEKLLFNPYPADNRFYKSAKEIWIPTSDDIDIHTLVIPGIEGDEDVILYLHGNRGNNNFGFYQTRPLLGSVGTIYVPDYRSYGKTKGSLSSDDQMIADMDSVMQYISNHHPIENVSIVGFSMGTGMAAALARNYRVKNLILVAPYSSLTDLKNHYLPIVPDFILKYDFPIDEYLEEVSCPIYLVHGVNDEVIPYNNSKILKEEFADKLKLFTSDIAGHRRIIVSDAVEECYEIAFPN